MRKIKDLVYFVFVSWMAGLSVAMFFRYPHKMDFTWWFLSVEFSFLAILNLVELTGVTRDMPFAPKFAKKKN